MNWRALRRVLHSFEKRDGNSKVKGFGNFGIIVFLVMVFFEKWGNALV